MDSEDPSSEELKAEKLPKGVTLKPHSYDGIHEYDQRLPRWWLFTLYGAVVFSAIYWLMLDVKGFTGAEHVEIEEQMAQIETLRLENSIDVTNNEKFWEMSENQTIVAKGKQTFQTNCVACHGENLRGGIGFNLVDAEWVHGSLPAEIYTTISKGVPEKGMQAWANLLGQKRITEVVAYIMSKNDRETLQAAAKQ